jgi:phosphoribosylglycinamide formyltransferase 1
VLRVAVLASGNGTNFQALHDACASGYVDAEITCVLSDRQSPKVFERAEAAGVETVFVAHKGLDREACDEVVLRELESRRIDLACYAGYMRIRGRTFSKELQGRILNIHPSLLPAFPGAQAIQDAWEWGVKASGATVHYATEELDAGPIIIQRSFEVGLTDTIETFEQKIHLAEYSIYPKALRLHAEGRLRIEGRRVLVDGDVDEVPWAGDLPPGLR